jgi:hypothetical protein
LLASGIKNATCGGNSGGVWRSILVFQKGLILGSRIIEPALPHRNTETTRQK